MNPTIEILCNRIATAWSTRGGEIRRLVHTDKISGNLPPPGELFNGQKVLLARIARRNRALAYYAGETIASAALALLCGLAAYLLGTHPDPAAWMAPASRILAAVALWCGFLTVACRFGPTYIDAARYQQAVSSLAESGDDDAKPLSVALMAGVAVMFLIDGSFSGLTLAKAAFASILSPQGAMWAAVAWSCAMAWMLYHLTQAAAREGAVNARRDLIRNLLASPREADRKRGESMYERVGHALHNDLARGARRIRARVTLAIVVLGLTTATLIVRLADESSAAMQAPDPVPLQSQ